MCVGRGEVRAGDEARAEGQDKQRARKNQGLQRRMLRNKSVVAGRNLRRAPIDGVHYDRAAALWK